MSYQTEEEQLAAIAQLWKKYGFRILIGIVLFAALVYGYHAWKNHQKKQSEQAASLYIQLTEATSGLQMGDKMTKSQKDSFKHVLAQLEKKHSNNIYTQYGQLLAAKIAVENNDMETARKNLNLVIGKTDDNNLKTLASIRLASILVSDTEKNHSGPKQALDILHKIKYANGFSVAIEDTRGDAWLALKNQDKARESYKKALAIAEKEGVKRPLIKLKLENIPPTNEVKK